MLVFFGFWLGAKKLGPWVCGLAAWLFGFEPKSLGLGFAASSRKAARPLALWLLGFLAFLIFSWEPKGSGSSFSASRIGFLAFWFFLVFAHTKKPKRQKAKPPGFGILVFFVLAFWVLSFGIFDVSAFEF